MNSTIYWFLKWAFPLIVIFTAVGIVKIISGNKGNKESRTTNAADGSANGGYWEDNDDTSDGDSDRDGGGDGGDGGD